MHVDPIPLAVAQHELRLVIEELEEHYYRLHDVNARASADGLRRLQRLRAQLDRVQEGTSRRRAAEITRKVLFHVAIEFVTRLVEAAIYYFAARQARLKDPMRIPRDDSTPLSRGVFRSRDHLLLACCNLGT